MAWTVFERKAAKKVLDKAPQEIRDKWTLWLEIVQHSGPRALRDIPGFHDEALKGPWAGHRASRLNIRYRVIYEVDERASRVIVEDVTRHDYSK